MNGEVQSASTCLYCPFWQSSRETVQRNSGENAKPSNRYSSDGVVSAPPINSPA